MFFVVSSCKKKRFCGIHFRLVGRKSQSAFRQKSIHSSIPCTDSFESFKASSIKLNQLLAQASETSHRRSPHANSTPNRLK